MKRLSAFIDKVNASAGITLSATDVAVKAACNSIRREQPLQVVLHSQIHGVVRCSECVHWYGMQFGRVFYDFWFAFLLRLTHRRAKEVSSRYPRGD